MENGFKLSMESQDVIGTMDFEETKLDNVFVNRETGQVAVVFPYGAIVLTLS